MIFSVCVAASRNISIFFNERAAASEKILTTASEIYQKKNERLILKENLQLLFHRIMST